MTLGTAGQEAATPESAGAWQVIADWWPGVRVLIVTGVTGVTGVTAAA